MAYYGIHSIRPNQTRKLFTMATNKGVKVFDIKTLAARAILKAHQVGSCMAAEMLFDSNILAVVGGGPETKFDEKCVVLIDLRTNQMVRMLHYPSIVLGVRFTRDKVVAILLDSVHISDLSTSKKLLVLPLKHNPKGLCELSQDGVMVIPADNVGQVQVVNLCSIKEGSTLSPTLIKAHDGNVACVAVSTNGKWIATASDKGTRIRIFDVHTKKDVGQLHRGVDTAKMYSMAFSPCDAFLSACSDKGTVHVFSIDRFISQRGSYVSNIMPKSLDSVSSVAKCTVSSEFPSVLVYLDNHTIVVICMDGTYLTYVLSEKFEMQKTVDSNTIDIGEDFDLMESSQ